MNYFIRIKQKNCQVFEKLSVTEQVMQLQTITQPLLH